MKRHKGFCIVCGRRFHGYGRAKRCAYCQYIYEYERTQRIRLTPLQADAARHEQAEQLALPAAQLKHGG